MGKVKSQETRKDWFAMDMNKKNELTMERHFLQLQGWKDYEHYLHTLLTKDSRYIK